MGRLRSEIYTGKKGIKRDIVVPPQPHLPFSGYIKQVNLRMVFLPLSHTFNGGWSGLSDPDFVTANGKGDKGKAVLI